jgi:hypothetical protein
MTSKFDLCVAKKMIDVLDCLTKASNQANEC